jgi:hypothetical protein
MMKARMIRSGINKVRHSQLPDPPQSLEIRMLDKLHHLIVGHRDDSVNGIVKDFE